MEAQTPLRIEYKNTKPIEVSVFTNSLSSIGSQYKKFALSKYGAAYSPQEAKLYIEKITEGSIITELVPYAVFALPLASNINTVVEFSKNLKLLLDSLLHNTKTEGYYASVTQGDLTDVQQILAPIAQDGSSQLIIAPQIAENATLIINLNSIEAGSIRDSASRKIYELKEPVEGFHSKVLLYFYQARDDYNSKSGDLGVIESISGKPVKTIFDTDELKQRFLGTTENIFKQAFIVDIQALTIQGKIKTYKVSHLHETIDR